MKNQVNPAVVVLAVVVALVLVVVVGFRAVNSTPKLAYPKNFNPAAPLVKI